MRKIIIRIFNVLFLVAAAMSIVSFLTKPLVELNVSVSIPATQVVEMIGNKEETPKAIKRDGGAEPTNTEDYDLAELLTVENLEKAGLSDVELKFNINVTPDSIGSYFDTKNNYEMLESAIDEFLVGFIDYACNYFSQILEGVTKIVAKEVISQQVIDQIKEHNPNAEQIFADTGCEEKVDKLVDKVVDKFEEGNVPVSELAATITDDEECGVKAIVSSLKEANVEGFQDVNVDDITPDQIQEALQGALTAVPGLTEERPVLDEFGNQVVDADGNPVVEIYVTDITSALMAILDQAAGGLGGGDSSSSESEGKIDVVEGEGEEKPIEEEKPEPIIEEGEGGKLECVRRLVLRDDADPTPDPAVEEPSKEEQLRQKVTEFIKGLIPFDIENIDYSAGGIMPWILLGVIVLGILPWALFAVITIIRTIRRKKCWTKPWIVFTFAFTQLIFGIGITLVFKFATPLIMQFAGAAIPAEFAALLPGLSVSFKTAAYISSIIYLAMIPLTIVYMILCHKVKKEFKQEKRNKKLAKKAA